MSKLLQGLKNALVAGLLVVLPAWLALLLIVGLLTKLGIVVKPIAGQLPDGVNHPQIVALASFLLVCLCAGLIVRTPAGRFLGSILGKHVFSQVPGYVPLRTIANQFADLDKREGFMPSLVEVEDGSLSPGFLIERHDDGRCTVFIPSAPTPMAGAILIMPGERVHEIDVPMGTILGCVSKWGTGAGELLAAMKSRPVALLHPQSSTGGATLPQ
jgi:uncharacterized membrane protein